MRQPHRQRAPMRRLAFVADRQNGEGATLELIGAPTAGGGQEGQAMLAGNSASWNALKSREDAVAAFPDGDVTNPSPWPSPPGREYPSASDATGEQ